MGSHHTVQLHDLPALATKILASSKERDVIMLIGDIGTGKTTFVKSLAAALGVGEHVTSPSYTVVTSYQVSRPPFTQLIHADFYRLAESTDRDPAVQEVVEQAACPGCLTVIEWPQRVRAIPAARQLHFAYTDNPDARRITIN